jgi:hypothetical protein
MDYILNLFKMTNTFRLTNGGMIHATPFNIDTFILKKR